jgi:hypothetical protein
LTTNICWMPPRFSANWMSTKRYSALPHAPWGYSTNRRRNRSLNWASTWSCSSSTSTAWLWLWFETRAIDYIGREGIQWITEVMLDEIQCGMTHHDITKFWLHNESISWQAKKRRALAEQSWIILQNKQSVMQQGVFAANTVHIGGYQMSWGNDRWGMVFEWDHPIGSDSDRSREWNSIKSPSHNRHGRNILLWNWSNVTLIMALRLSEWGILCLPSTEAWSSPNWRLLLALFELVIFKSWQT